MSTDTVSDFPIPRPTIKIADIKIGERMRKQYSGIERLAESLEEHGLIQPIVLNENDELIAGGRRLAAATLLGWEAIEFTYKSTLDEANLRELELEENVRREDMTWQEKVLTIAEIHRLRSSRSILNAEPWGYKETGEMLGLSVASISNALAVAKELKKPDSPIHFALNLRDALRALVELKENEAMRKLSEVSGVASITIPKGDAATKVTFTVADADKAVPMTKVVDGDNSFADKVVVPAMADEVELAIDLSKVIYHGDSIAIMKSMPDQSVDHIVCDPPYAIDMGMLRQTHQGINVDLVKDTHHVEQNVNLLADFITQADRLIKPGGFLVFWFDFSQSGYLMDLLSKTDFAVQDWPIVWCKSTAMNQCAGYNFTKATEFCLVARRKKATLVEYRSKNWINLMPSIEDSSLFSGHPFSKPILLWEWLLKAVTLRGQVVLDPFAGRGSSTVAAIRLGLQPIAIELEEHHIHHLTRNVKEAFLTVYPNAKFYGQPTTQVQPTV